MMAGVLNMLGTGIWMVQHPHYGRTSDIPVHAARLSLVAPQAAHSKYLTDRALSQAPSQAADQ
jgi:hypothetical protein